MGHYVSLDDISRELGYDFDATTQPTSDDIDEFITMVEAEVNGAVSALGATVPVDSNISPGSYDILRHAIIWGVCAHVLGAFGGIVSSDAPKADSYWQKYKDFLSRLKSSPRILYDALWPENDSEIGGITDEDEDYHEPFFTMDGEF